MGELENQTSGSFAVTDTDPRKADGARNQSYFNGAQLFVGSAANLYYAQANPADNAQLGDVSVVTQVTPGDLSQSAALLTSGGVITANVSAVPVPAAAWLFGSALAGLLVARRNK
jgi:hypothetical protein